jgi:autotransporter-associated beta strand protein
VGRLTATGTNVVVQLNAITNLAVFTVNSANGHTVRAMGPVMLSGQGSSNRFNNGATLRLEGLIGELTPGSVLDKSGTGTLMLTNLQNHTYSGGTIIRAGTVTVLTTAAVTNPLGTGGEITMYGGTLALRDTASRTVGAGANINGGNGYNLTAAGTNANVVVDVNRYTGTSQNSELRLNNLTLTNGASFQVNGGNNYTLAFLGGTFLGNGTNHIINVNNGRSTQPFSLRLVGPITSANPATARLIKPGGYNELGYVNNAAPDHQGGTWITAGGLTWRPTGLAGGS